jgi:hypothetical protein
MGMNGCFPERIQHTGAAVDPVRGWWRGEGRNSWKSAAGIAMVMETDRKRGLALPLPSG